MSLIANSEMRVRQAVRQIVTWLVAGDYVAIESKSNGIRLSADDFRHVINEFSHRLVMPPDSAFADFEIIEVNKAATDHPEWVVSFDLWTSEGISDLTLECRLIDVGGTDLAYETDNLHVL